MKISLTNWEQTLLGLCILYSLDTGFLATSKNYKLQVRNLQTIVDKFTINTPIKSGGENAISKNYL